VTSAANPTFYSFDTACSHSAEYAVQYFI